MCSDILDNIDGHIFLDVEGFHKKYFERQESSFLSDNQTQSFVDYITAIRTNSLGKSLRRDQVVKWLDETNKHAELQWHQTNKDDRELTSVRLTKTTRNRESDNTTFIRAIGVVLDSNLRQYRSGFAELCKDAGVIFANDPLRLFIHAFIIYGDNIQPWMIDRSGIYSGKAFSLSNEPERFVQMIDVYRLQPESKLGANTYCKHVEAVKSVFQDSKQIDRDVRPLHLDQNPIAYDDWCEIISAAPTVYFATRHSSSERDMVVKFKWRREFEPAEGHLFKSITEVQPKSVVNLYHAEDIASTSELREGLKFGPAVKLKDEDLDNHMTEHTDVSSMYFVRRHPDTKGDEAYMNRILSCTAICPRGVALEHYQNPLQAIRAFRDALQGLRALYQRCKLLHRDVSIFNILLTDTSRTKEDQASAGFLIDIEGALDLTTPPERNQIIGTTVFKAVGLLQRQLPHTYRYDLESFFYSFLWFCINPRLTKIRPEQDSLLSRWRGPDQEELAQAKLHDMHEANFGSLLEEFHPDFRRFTGLASRIRGLLFPMHSDGTLWTGTDLSEEGTNILYDNISREFELVLQNT